MNSTTQFAHAVRPMALERVHFYDGMILTADDLEAERRYHLDRSRMINRGVFGCGIVCGLDVKKSPDDVKMTHFVCVHPGIAIDCHGDPLELCRPVKLDLDPDPCKCPPPLVCILIRRRDGKPDGHHPCGCGPSSDDGPRRVRDEVEIRVVEAPASGSVGDLCWNPPPEPKDVKDGWTQDDLCNCLKACEPCDDCNEGWILLACVGLKKSDENDKETSQDRDCWYIDEIDHSGRKYIKPIQCFCPRPPEQPAPQNNKPGDTYEEPKKTPAKRSTRSTTSTTRRAKPAR